MRVLYLMDGQGGGAMTHVLDLAEGLREEGISAEIVFFTPGPSVEEARKRRIPAHLVPRRGIGLVFLVRLWAFLRGSRADILHTHTVNGNFFGRIAGRLAGVPILATTVHSLILDELKGLKEPSLGDRVRYQIDLLLSRWVQGMVVVSDAIRDRLCSHGVPAEKLTLIENGVDTRKFRPDERKRKAFRAEMGFPEDLILVGIVGRLVPLKNHEVFLHAAQIVAGRRPDVRFLIVGDGPLKREIEESLKRRGLEGRVRMLGWRGDLEDILPAIDFLVLCSQVEGHNIAVLEAMACGLPVVGTDIRGIAMTVHHGETGVLVPVGDAEALAGAMIDLAARPADVRGMGSKARKYVEERYGIGGMVSAYRRFYREVSA